MAEKKTALIAGATGLVGSHCLDLLIKNPNYGKVIVLSRSAKGIPKSEKIETRFINFDDLGNLSFDFRIDQIFCALGTTIKKAGSKENFKKVDYSYPLQLAKCGLSWGTDHYIIVSAMGANPDSHIFYNRVKGEIEAKLVKLNYRAVSILRPSLLLGNRKENRLGEKISKVLMSIFDFAIPKKYKAVEAENVAAAMIHLAMENKPGLKILESDKIREVGLKYFNSGKQ